MCSCSQKSNISNLPTASLCCAGSITYKCIGKIQNMKVYLYRPQFENVHFLWVNNASTSFFTHFYSINFIYTAYFAWNYFIFTSYMKYFRLWSFSIVTALAHVHEAHKINPRFDAYLGAAKTKGSKSVTEKNLFRHFVLMGGRRLTKQYLDYVNSFTHAHFSWFL